MSYHLPGASDKQKQKHGRLVIRLKKRIAAYEHVSTELRRAAIFEVLHELMVLEDRIANPGGPWEPVTADDVRRRLVLMQRGAGLVIAR